MVGQGVWNDPAEEHKQCDRQSQTQQSVQQQHHFLFLKLTVWFMEQALF
jgi:hypothetical protein